MQRSHHTPLQQAWQCSQHLGRSILAGAVYSPKCLEGASLLKKSVEGLWMDLNRVQRPKKWCHRGQKEAQKRVPESFSTRSGVLGSSSGKFQRPPIRGTDG